MLLLLLFALSAQNALGVGTDYWMYLHIQVDCYPTGSGKVYASTTQSSAQNSNNCTNSPYIDDVSTAESYVKNGKTLWYVNTVPTDASKWAFKGWVKDAAQGVDYYNTTYVSTDRNPTEGFKDPGSYASSTADGKGGKVDHNTKPYYRPDPFPITLHMTAVYESIKPDVIAVTNNGELGATEFSEANNSVGETVVLRATPSHYNSKFEGWYKDGVLISKENPFSFTITNENKGTYTARFVEHKFMRIKNSTTNRYINGVNDQGSITNFSSLQLEGSKDATRYQAGTVIYLWDYTRTNPTAHPYVFDIQGFSSKSYYNDTKGEYVTILHNNESDTWTISDKDKSYFMTDKGGTSVEMGAINAGFPLNWEFEHIDNDLSTCENYFSLDPAKLVQVGDKYYTTLRTSWNILFNPEQMTPYVVTSIDEETGTFEMEPITGNIIPLGTPVIIETKSTSIEENRMVPTLTNAANGAVPSGNLLQVSTKYFPNQSAPVPNCKGLYKNANGQLAFGGNALSTVNGNEAYLSVANEVVHDVQPVLTETTLANLLKNGEIGPNYKITDLTCVYIQGNTLYCKDDNKALKKSVKAEGEIDYIKQQTGFQSQDWDQSNWIAITVPEGSEITTSILDHRLNNVVGRLKSKVNPEFEATMMPTAGEPNAYDENTYITCNFSSEHQQGILNGKKTNVFFVAPKPMEIAEVQWAMWDDDLKKFIIPIAAQGSQLQGAFSHNFSMLEAESEPVLIEGNVYHFPALIKVVEAAQGNAPRLAASDSNSWMVYPLEWNDEYDDTPTAIGGMPAGKEVNRVVYYNLLGVASDHPFKGVNIVVTEYDDGSKSTRKTVVR